VMYYLKVRNYTVLFLFFGWMLCSTGCASDSATSTSADTKAKADTPKAFFDIDGYFDAEINALNSSTLKLKKDAKIDGKSESQTIEKPNWNTELKLFKDSDINKIAWVDKYSTEKKSNSIVYTTADSTLTTKRIQIDYKSAVTDNFEDVVSILIINNTENVLYSSSEFLTYTPKSSISIIRNQQIKTGDNKMVEIKGMIVK